MKKLLVFLILSSLITGCQSIPKPEATTMTDNVNKIKVTIEYYGDLSGENKGVKKESINTPMLGIMAQPEIIYLIDVEVAPQATMAELISAFHTTTGLKTSYKFWGGAPPNRTSHDVFYTHVANKKLVDSDNEQLTLQDWNINQNTTVILEITGGGLFD